MTNPQREYCVEIDICIKKRIYVDACSEKDAQKRAYKDALIFIDEDEITSIEFDVFGVERIKEDADVKNENYGGTTDD